MKQTKIVDKYCSAWNEIDKDKRTETLKEIWEEGAKYIDPRADLTGVEEFVNHIEKIKLSRPGTRVTRTSKLDLHHGIGRFNWNLKKDDGTILLEGLDIVYFDNQGLKIQKIIGFFGVLE